MIGSILFSVRFIAFDGLENSFDKKMLPTSTTGDPLVWRFARPVSQRDGTILAIMITMTAT